MVNKRSENPESHRKISDSKSDQKQTQKETDSTRRPATQMSYQNGDVHQLAQGVSQVSLGTAPRKKRPARAHHTLQNQASMSNLNSTEPSPNLHHQNAFSQPNLYQSSQPGTPGTPGTPGIPHFTNAIGNDPTVPQPPQVGFHQQHFQQHPAPAAATNVPVYNAVDPSKINDTLSVPAQRQVSQSEWKTESFKSFENTLPPTSTTQFHSIDQSVSTPKFCKLSMYQIPVSEQLRATTKLPLGLTVRPFAPPDFEDETVPVVDMKETNGPLRCRRCRTYLNPMMRFTNDGKFICNMCKVPNPVPSEYYAQLDAAGRRVDQYVRPELHKGTVDFIVPESYWVEDGVAPNVLHHIFLIDVSAPPEIIRASTEAIETILYNLPNPVKVGIITYDDRVHFYNLNSEVLQIQVAADLDDPFIPINDGLFVDPSENQFQISNALNTINELYSNFQPAVVSYGAALKYAHEALKTVGGGKITATLSKTPSNGPGLLVNTNNNDKGEPETFRPNSEFYIKLSNDFINSNVGLDLFVISNSSVDLKNSALPVLKTGGNLKLFSNFQVETDETQFIQDFSKAVLNTTGYQAQLKVRCSNGLQVQSYYGNFDVRADQDPKFPVVSSDQEISVLFKYDSKLDAKEDVHFQTAVLYTGIDGVRKVRVTNVVAAVTSDISNTFAFAYQDVVLNIIIKICLSHLHKQHSTEIKLTTATKLVEIFSQYRLLSSSNSNPTQLIMPDSLSTLTAYISAFQKSKVFKTSINNNIKLYDYYQLNALTLDRLLLKLYPRVIALNELLDHEAIFDETGRFQMPKNLKASSEFITLGGAFLFFNGEKVYVYIHSRVNPLLLQDLFGVGSIEELSPYLRQFPTIDTLISQQARNLVSYLQSTIKSATLDINIVRQSIDPSQFEINDLLVEDRAVDKTPSFVELITSIHKQIREKLQNASAPKINDIHEDESTLSQRFLNL